jgi:hypothetical protein
VVDACRQQANALVASIVRYNLNDPSAFVMITGISDSRGFTNYPSWMLANTFENRCYVGALASHFPLVVALHHARMTVPSRELDLGADAMPAMQRIQASHVRSCRSATQQQAAPDRSATSCVTKNRVRAATAAKPAADIAAQVATALALLAHYFRTTPNAGDRMKGELADACEERARAAYSYAASAFAKYGDLSTCTASAAASNCIGTCAGAATPVRRRSDASQMHALFVHLQHSARC